MAQKIVKHGVVGALVCLLGLAACSSATPTSMPTQDMNPFRTEVAATVFAQVTYDLALTPSITPIPSSTATITPTTTPILPTSAIARSDHYPIGRHAGARHAGADHCPARPGAMGLPIHPG